MVKRQAESNIDFVITWVDGNDPEWRKEKAKWSAKEKPDNKELFKEWANNEMRYREWGTLKYCLRSIEKYAPWARYVFLVTCGHTPIWLNQECKKLKIVKHCDFIPKQYLPTFNSNAIELNLHRIKQLSRHFVYLNDDMILTAPVKPTDFFKDEKLVTPVGLDCVHLDYDIMHSEINNMKILNKYFNKKECIKKNWRKWHSLKNGKYLAKTALLSSWDRFTGMSEPHVSVPHIKVTFDELWKKEPELLDETCSARFRHNEDINHWLMKEWCILTGNFYVGKYNFGKSFHKEIDDDIIKCISKEKYKCICINDIECTDEEYRSQKDKLINGLEKKYPEQSIFEKPVSKLSA